MGPGAEPEAALTLDPSLELRPQTDLWRGDKNQDG